MIQAHQKDRIQQRRDTDEVKIVLTVDTLWTANKGEILVGDIAK